MALSFADDIKDRIHRSDTSAVDPRIVEIRLDQPHRRGRKALPEVGAVLSLAQNIRDSKQLEPVLFLRTLKPAIRLELLAGFTRYEAQMWNTAKDWKPDLDAVEFITSLRAGKLPETLPKFYSADLEKRIWLLEGKVVQAEDYNPTQQYLMTLSENHERNPLTEIDIAEAVRHLINNFGYTELEVRTFFSRKIDPETGNKVPMSASWLANIRALNGLDDSIQGMIIKKELGASHGYLLAEYDASQHLGILEDAKKASKEGKITGTAITEAARKRGLVKPGKALKPTQLNRVWNDWAKDEDPRIQQLGKWLKDLQGGKLAEAELVGALRDMLANRPAEPGGGQK